MKFLMIGDLSPQMTRLQSSLLETGYFRDYVSIRQEHEILGVLDCIDDFTVVIVEYDPVTNPQNLKALLPFVERLLPKANLFVATSDRIELGGRVRLLNSLQSIGKMTGTILMELAQRGSIKSSPVQGIQFSKDVSQQHALERLSPRHTEVLALMADGRSNKEIAKTLGIAEGTVKSHSSIILKTLGVTNRTQAALIYQKASD